MKRWFRYVIFSLRRVHMHYVCINTYAERFMELISISCQVFVSSIELPVIFLLDINGWIQIVPFFYFLRRRRPINSVALTVAPILHCDWWWMITPNGLRTRCCCGVTLQLLQRRGGNYRRRCGAMCSLRYTRCQSLLNKVKKVVCQGGSLWPLILF